MDNDVVIYQSGRRSAGGECKREKHDSAANAGIAARRQWAAKEAKGYWPVAGVVPLPSGTLTNVHSGDEVAILVDRSLRQAAGEILRCTAPPAADDRVCLVQLPPFGHATDSVLYAVDSLARRVGAPIAAVQPGSFQLLPVPQVIVEPLRALCPVMLDAGAWGDTNAVLLGQTALQMAQDLHSADNSREAFSLAVRLVDALS